MKPEEINIKTCFDKFLDERTGYEDGLAEQAYYAAWGKCLYICKTELMKDDKNAHQLLGSMIAQLNRFWKDKINIPVDTPP